MTAAINSTDCAERSADALDVVIVGAGLSGIGSACHLLRAGVAGNIAILEARERSGGTWDLFRYPGIRSDSDMHTLSYSFRPWRGDNAITDGPSILSYLRDTAREFGVDGLIRYRKRLSAANWNSARQLWELRILDIPSGEEQRLDTRFLLMCAGYYSYAQGHQPEFPGREDFAGDFVHPQFWPEDLDCRDKRVVVIGSGATAVTLVPALAKEGAEVVMLQRSPTWLVTRPARDRIANLARRLLPESWAFALARWKNTRLQSWFYGRTRRRPERVRHMLLKEVQRQLGDAGDISDFTPRYDPWDQRLCVVPDGDMFKALKSGHARVVTACIERLVPEGIRLEGGELLPADVIVSATGLELQLMGGTAISVDGKPFDFPSSWSYRGMMCSGLPNLVSVFGYINASWTLRSDIIAQWVCRLLEYMHRIGAASVTAEPEPGLPEMTPRPWIDDFSAGYMQRVMHLFPKQGDREPWLNSQNYLRERRQFAEMDFSEAALHYSTPRTLQEGGSGSPMATRPLRA